MSFKWMKGHWCAGWEDYWQDSKHCYTFKEFERELKSLIGNHNYCFMCGVPFDAEERKARQEMLDLVEMARL